MGAFGGLGYLGSVVVWPLLGRPDLPDIVVPNISLPAVGLVLKLPEKDAYGRSIIGEDTDLVIVPACGSCSARKVKLQPALSRFPEAVFVFDYVAKDQTDKVYRKFPKARIIFDPRGRIYKRAYILIAPFVVKIKKGAVTAAEKL